MNAEARLALPNMPEEVFTSWFDDMVAQLGWPPVGERWEMTLRSFPFHDWKRMKWEKNLVELHIDRFVPSAKEIIRSLLAAHLTGTDNEFSVQIKGWRERLKSIEEYVEEYHRLPSALIFLDCGGQWQIADGSHRLAYYFASTILPDKRGTLSNRQEAWIGAMAR